MRMFSYHPDPPSQDSDTLAPCCCKLTAEDFQMSRPPETVPLPSRATSHKTMPSHWQPMFSDWIILGEYK